MTNELAIRILTGDVLGTPEQTHDAIKMAVEALSQLDVDTISRQSAIDVAMQYCPDDDGSCSKAGADIREMLDELEALPPAQPEIIRCKNCIHWDKSNLLPPRCKVFDWFSKKNDYCSFAERRSE